jgi:tetratricopeptide (TPR) repeat protein
MTQLADILSRGLAGRYRVEREVGRGGMATVFLAEDLRYGRPVAVKVLLPELASAVGSERFLREIRIAAGLRHPNILPVLDSGAVEGLPFYVMPFVEGESLREKLLREKQLPIAEVIQIGREVADALFHAHERGVVHRDIKPANIMLDSGHAVVTDFGIALATQQAGSDRLSATGASPGSPHYMSPEQAAGERDIDGRSDIYSLGCVLYEALAGDPPFTGRMAQAILAKKLTEPPPSLRTVRDAAPLALERAISRCLVRAPADRFRTAGELRDALDGAELAGRLDEVRTALEVDQLGRSGGRSTPLRPLDAGTRRLVYTGGTVILVAAIGLFTVDRLAPDLWQGAPLDTTVYAVVPFAAELSDGGPNGVDVGLREAMAAWDGIRVAEARVGLDARGGSDVPVSWDEILDAAREIGAARIVTGNTREAGDSLRVVVELRDAADVGSPLHRVESLLPLDGIDRMATDSALARLAEAILFRGGGVDGSASPSGGTRSAAARRAFERGWQALREWDLVEADRSFSRAAEEDPYFELALLWKAQTMNWQGQAAAEWEADARRAANAADELPRREGLLAAALAEMSYGRHPRACEIYDELRAERPEDFAAWFGIGECNRRDVAVLPDAESKTGWRFRGSAHAAATAFRTALEGLPSTYRAFGAGSFELVESMLYIGPALPQGRGPPPRHRSFLGFMEWRGDSLAMFPVPVDSLRSYEPDFEAESEAATRQNRALLDVANAWVRAFPNSGDALYALGVARERVGDPVALDTYRSARELTGDARLRRAAGVAEVILGVRLHLPDGLNELRAAVALGDSLLWEADDSRSEPPNRLDEIAVLLGRPALAARLARLGPDQTGLGDMASEVVRVAHALLPFAAAGGPVDSIRALSRLVERGIERTVPLDRRRVARQSLLEQPAFLAFPADTLQYLDDRNVPASASARAMAALADGDAEAARRVLGEAAIDAGWDILLAHANVLVALGEETAALELLGPRLDDIAAEEPVGTRGVTRLGGLVRSAALRAELESKHGSAGDAARWARAVSVLWSAGETAVEPVLTRLNAIAEANAVS